MPDWAARVEDHDIGTAARYVHALADRTGLELTSYRSLQRTCQRARLRRRRATFTGRGVVTRIVQTGDVATTFG